MSDFVVVKNIKASLADIQITDGMPLDNVDYALMVDVALYEEKIKKGTGEENPDRTFIFQPSGSIVMINKNKMNERINADFASGQAHQQIS